MVHEYLNFNETHGIEGLFKMTEVRAMQLHEQLLGIEQEIVSNIGEYSHESTEQSPGDGLNSGKTLERILKIAESPNEELALIFAFNTFIDRIVRAVQLDRVSEVISKLNTDDIINEL